MNTVWTWADATLSRPFPIRRTPSPRRFSTHDTPRYPAPLLHLADACSSTSIDVEANKFRLPAFANNICKVIRRPWNPFLTRCTLCLCWPRAALVYASRHYLSHYITSIIPPRHTIIPGVYGVYRQADVVGEAKVFAFLTAVAGIHITTFRICSLHIFVLTRQCTGFIYTVLHITTQLS